MAGAIFMITANPLAVIMNMYEMGGGAPGGASFPGGAESGFPSEDMIEKFMPNVNEGQGSR